MVKQSWMSPHKMSKIRSRSGLTELETKFPALLSRARGRGTFCAVDLPTVAARYHICILLMITIAGGDLGLRPIDQIYDQGHIAVEAEASGGSLGRMWRVQRQDQVPSSSSSSLTSMNSKNFLF